MFSVGLKGFFLLNSIALRLQFLCTAYGKIMDFKSLQEFCLQAIMKHLDRFSWAFNATTDPDLKRNFEFLQRCYSNEMLTLSTEDSIKEAYFPLLLNSHLSEINLGVLARFGWEIITQKIAEIGEGLLKISFITQCNERRSGYHAPDAPPFANMFPFLKNITILNFENCCDDEALKNISKYCPHLVELMVTRGRVTNEGVRKYLCQKNERNEAPTSKLRKLEITCLRVDDDVRELILMSFPDLEELDIFGIDSTLYRMHQEDIFQNNFSNVRKFKLTKLNLLWGEHSHSAEFLKFCSLICPDVNFLEVEVLLPDELGALANFKKLKKLYLDASMDPSRLNVNSFLLSVGPRLTVLSLCGYSFSVEVLINSCPLLEELELSNISFQPFVKNSTKTLKFLKIFVLFETRMDDAATSKSVSAIFSSTRILETMHFDNCSFLTDEVRDAVLNCCTRCPLKEVNFMETDSDFSLLKSILLSSCKLKELCVYPSFRNLNRNDVDLLNHIVSNLANKPKFEYVESFEHN